MGVFYYSSGQIDVNSYMPLVKLYAVATGIYIVHIPSGNVSRQLVTFCSTTLYPEGHEVSARVK